MTAAIPMRIVDRVRPLPVLVRCRSHLHSNRRDVASTYVFFDTPTIRTGAYHCAAHIASDDDTAPGLLGINAYDIAGVLESSAASTSTGPKTATVRRCSNHCRGTSKLLRVPLSNDSSPERDRLARKCRSALPCRPSGMVVAPQFPQWPRGRQDLPFGTSRLEVASSPSRHFLEGKAVAIWIRKPSVLDAISDLFDRGDVHASAYQFGACLFDIGNN